MALFPFHVKRPELYTDPLFGYPAAHPDLKAMLAWLCDLCERERWQPPLVVEFGRTRDDMERYYLPAMLQQLEHVGAGNDSQLRLMARDMARSRFSWHCIPKPPSAPLVRAMDLRDWIYSDDVRQQLVAEGMKKYPTAEILDHAVPGGARHFHWGVPDPDGKPADWF